MPFEPAKFESRTSPTVSPMRYSVRRTTSAGRVCTLQLSVTRKLVHDAGIKEGEGVRLDIDHKAKMGRICAIHGAQRSFRGKGRKGASYVLSFPYNGEIAKYFPQPTGNGKGAMTAALKVEAITRENGLIFALP
jgi:hypothetical protein